MQDEMVYSINKTSNEIDALKADIERYRLIIECSSDGFWDWNLTNDTAYLSKEWSEILGFNQQVICQYYGVWKQLIHPQDRGATLKTLTDCYKEKRQTYASEYRLKVKKGEYIWVASKGKLMFNEQGDPIRITGSHTDISEKKKMEKQLEQLAYHDQLTGTLIRNVFMEKLQTTIESADAGQLKPTVMFLDIDNFKTINDIYGHYIGDIVLQKVSKRLKSCIKSAGILCRIGGDEFVILLPEGKDFNEIVQRIIKSFKTPIIADGHKLAISTSVGISQYNGDKVGGETLVKRADIAMYKAKERGKNNIQYYTDRLLEERNYYKDIRRDLVYAIQEQQLYLSYQPLIDAKTKKVTGVEALIRWRHSKRGIISPVDFISLAEGSKLIIPIGEWVFESAVRQLKKWHDAGFKNLKISINVSSVQLQSPNFASAVCKILSDTGIQPSSIGIEITESALIKTMDILLDNLKVLQKQGIKVYIDDYGTGYNSLNLIKNFHVDYIKIDKSFVNVNENINRNIIKHIVALGHSINAEIVAEGVETIEQYEFLVNEGCDIIQGYYFSKPLLPEQVTELMMAN